MRITRNVSASQSQLCSFILKGPSRGFVAMSDSLTQPPPTHLAWLTGPRGLRCACVIWNPLLVITFIFLGEQELIKLNVFSAYTSVPCSQHSSDYCYLHGNTLRGLLYVKMNGIARFVVVILYFTHRQVRFAAKELFSSLLPL